MVIKPFVDGCIFILIQVHLDGFQHWLHVKDVLSVIKRRFLVVEWWEPHSLEVMAISFFPPHHNPHSRPLRNKHGFDDPGDLVYKCYRPRDVIQDLHVSNLLPRHGHVLQQLQHSMRHILERPQIHPFIVAKLPVGHITVILHDLAQVLGGHVLFLDLDIPEFTLLPITLLVQSRPLDGLVLQNLGTVHRLSCFWPADGGHGNDGAKYSFLSTCTR
mmetsp:Transcript_28888/g.46177  ORF Transcript_28888/g.46177 Transcript_28888/m.46177 type:complete len:216 (-) Transcript_28888:40-687(-)